LAAELPVEPVPDPPTEAPVALEPTAERPVEQQPEAPTVPEPAAERPVELSPAQPPESLAAPEPTAESLVEQPAVQLPEAPAEPDLTAEAPIEQPPAQPPEPTAMPEPAAETPIEQPTAHAIEALPEPTADAPVEQPATLAPQAPVMPEPAAEMPVEQTPAQPAEPTVAPEHPATTSVETGSAAEPPGGGDQPAEKLSEAFFAPPDNGEPEQNPVAGAGGDPALGDATRQHAQASQIGTLADTSIPALAAGMKTAEQQEEGFKFDDDVHEVSEHIADEAKDELAGTEAADGKFAETPKDGGVQTYQEVDSGPVQQHTPEHVGPVESVLLNGALLAAAIAKRLKGEPSD
jgi:hypothetical protein